MGWQPLAIQYWVASGSLVHRAFVQYASSSGRKIFKGSLQHSFWYQLVSRIESCYAVLRCCGKVASYFSQFLLYILLTWACLDNFYVLYL